MLPSRSGLNLGAGELVGLKSVWEKQAQSWSRERWGREGKKGEGGNRSGCGAGGKWGQEGSHGAEHGSQEQCGQQLGGAQQRDAIAGPAEAERKAGPTAGLASPDWRHARREAYGGERLSPERRQQQSRRGDALVAVARKAAVARGEQMGGAGGAQAAARPQWGRAEGWGGSGRGGTSQAEVAKRAERRAERWRKGQSGRGRLERVCREHGRGKQRGVGRKGPANHGERGEG
ncbi:unnamed protein product [Closterium sp. NIES-65]|nr:unnamed protein product [Closterium sp. NIES-65]